MDVTRSSRVWTTKDGQRIPVRYSEGRIRSGFVTRAQAERTAWRIVLSWVEAQIAIVESGMVSMEEVFLLYLLTDSKSTVRDHLPEMIQRLQLPEIGTRDSG